MSQGYSCNATVAAVRSFYEFLTILPSLSQSAILEPPLSGWPDINANSHELLRKNETVIDLLRHLPYIDEYAEGCSQVSYQTTVIQHNGPSARWSLSSDNVEGTMEPVGCGKLPDYVVALTQGGRYGSWLLLDTHAGRFDRYRKLPRSDTWLTMSCI